MLDKGKIICRTPTKGRNGEVRLPEWKYTCIRQAILDVLEDSHEGQIVFMNLAENVSSRLTSNQLAKLGSVKWHVTTVKLNMEVEGEIERIPRLSPQTLRKST